MSGVIRDVSNRRSRSCSGVIRGEDAIAVQRRHDEILEQQIADDLRFRERLNRLSAQGFGVNTRRRIVLLIILVAAITSLWFVSAILAALENCWVCLFVSVFFMTVNAGQTGSDYSTWLDSK